VTAAPTLHRPALAVLAASAFVYVSAELLPIGLLPEIAGGLHVTEARVGLLLTAYALVAGLSTIPLTAVTMRIPRNRLITATVAVFAVSQAAAALAPDFGVLVVARLVCALAHGVFWSALAPVAARLAPPGRSGQATALVFLGNSLAIVLGVPLSTALGQWLGWRIALGVLACGGAVCVAALLTVVPTLSAGPAVRTGARLRASVTIIRSGPVAAVCVITAVLVIGHFAAYTYIAPLVRRDGELSGAGLSLLLLGYGAAGLAANAAMGRWVDRRPGVLLLGNIAAIVVALAVLTPVLGVVPTVSAVLLWGGAFTATPVCLQAAILRVAPQARDAASAVYVVAFQIGIGGGALLGELLVTAGHLAVLPIVGGATALAAGLLVLGVPRVFPRTPLPVKSGESAAADR
jgi:predicted MFS family arabinose efflux permease